MRRGQRMNGSSAEDVDIGEDEKQDKNAPIHLRRNLSFPHGANNAVYCDKYCNNLCRNELEQAASIRVGSERHLCCRVLIPDEAAVMSKVGAKNAMSPWVMTRRNISASCCPSSRHF